MARDMDFSPSRRARPIVTATPLQEPNSASRPTAATAPQQPARNNSWLIIMIILIVIAVGAYAFWRYFQPVPTTHNAAVSSTLTPPTPTIDGTSTNNLLATKNTLPTVQIYDSGAGSDAVTAVITKLKGIGYEAQNEAKSQFNYPKTYIWYITGLQADAVKIQSALTGRNVELKESKSAGSFQILILLGTK